MEVRSIIRNKKELSSNLIPVFSSNVKTIESKERIVSFYYNQALWDKAKNIENNKKDKETNVISRFIRLVDGDTAKLQEVYQSSSQAFELSTGHQSASKALTESHGK